VVASGCALLTHGRSQLVGIMSEPPSAKVTVDGQVFGSTPVYVKLERKYDHTVEIELEGFLPYKGSLTRKVTGWVWGNIFFGGIIGLVVDHATGAIYRLEPWQLAATLSRDSESLRQSKDAIHIILVPKAQDDWQRIGSMVRVPLNPTSQ